MTDKYHDLIFNSTLYSDDFIQEFGVSSTHWLTDSNRKRELALRHNLCCIYLCNLQEVPMITLLKNLSECRKRKAEYDIELQEQAGPAKQVLLGESQEPQPSTSTQTEDKSVNTSSSGTSGTISLETSESNYRFHLIEGMPNPAIIQNTFAEQWGINPPNSKWDIVDVHTQKFIEVKVSNRIDLQKRAYEIKKAGMKRHTALCVINPNNGDITWVDHQGGLQGETKVRIFIITRASLMKSMGVLDSDIQDEPNLIEAIFTNKYFNEEREKWVSDWWPTTVVPKITESLREMGKTLKSVTPHDLLEGLDDLEGPERTKLVEWKAKILPEGWVHNIRSFETTDKALVSQFFTFYLEQEWSFDSYNVHNKDKENLIDFLSDRWYLSGENNFSVNIGTIGEASKVKTLLGERMKGRKSNPNAEDTIQEEYHALEKRKYHEYYDEIIYRMSLPHNEDFNPLVNLLHEFNEAEHPISSMSNDAAKTLINISSKTNAGVFSSKLTNLYSRLGGTYLITNKKSNKTTHSAIAFMPIYSTLWGSDMKKKYRLLSGIVVRGKQHARSPTDKIPILTLEILPNNVKNRFLLYVQNKHMVWHNNDFIIAARENSVMKESTAFVTFNSNSLFMPANLIGVMTMENQYVPPTINMEQHIKSFLAESEKWFVERFVEGVIVSAVATTLDEGYFAQLRKLYMLILSYRRNLFAANWDIQEFCDKTNECLIDNPFSMYLHKTLLLVLKIYKDHHERRHRP